MQQQVIVKLYMAIGAVSGSIVHRNGRTVAATAVYSSCKRYRYRLTRDLSDDLLESNQSAVLFVMLNPSTATEQQDDPTIRKIQGFARSWGYGRLLIGNAFAFRATDPNDMKRTASPIGPDNDEHLSALARAADRVIVAWGKDGRHLNRERQVLQILANSGSEIYCLGQNGDGTPRHPLYLKSSTKPVILESSK